MANPLRTSPSRLHARRCVRCGYDGALLKDGRAPRCARCGCDLLRRPPLSYAEMEGFVTRDPPAADGLSRDEQRLIERWLIGMLAALVAIVAACAILTRLAFGAAGSTGAQPPSDASTPAAETSATPSPTPR